MIGVLRVGRLNRYRETGPSSSISFHRKARKQVRTTSGLWDLRFQKPVRVASRWCVRQPGIEFDFVSLERAVHPRWWTFLLPRPLTAATTHKGDQDDHSLAGRVMTKQPPPQEAQWPGEAIFAVGHSTLPIEQFISLLHAYGIASLTSAQCRARAITRNSTGMRLGVC